MNLKAFNLDSLMFLFTAEVKGSVKGRDEEYGMLHYFTIC